MRRLRARLLLALVATSAVTLVASAVAVLSPLNDRLRRQSANTTRDAVFSARAQLNGSLQGGGRDPAGNASVDAENLQRRIGGRVILYDTSGAVDPSTGQGEAITPVPDVNVSGDDDPSDVIRASIAPRRTISSRGGDGIRIAMPLASSGGHSYVLAVRKPYTDVNASVTVVRKALLVAGLIGLAIALVFGIVLATTLSRRLGRLRAAAVRIAGDGPDTDVPLDKGRDEVGDLARALQAMQHGLRRQEEARRSFVATASHELRTPLTSLSGTLELLAEDLDAGRIDVDDMREQIAGARVELERLRSLSAELLDLSRLDAGVALRTEPVELVEIARAIAAELELQARAAGAAIELELSPGPCWARADPDAVARIARILVDNALRYGAAGGPVTISAAYQGDVASLAVEDTGPGVGFAERDAIFQRFRRGRASAQVSGFGLGLAIGRELAVRLGGTLALDPAYDAGARFVLTLPIEMPAGGAPHSGSTIEADDPLDSPATGARRA